MPTAPQLIMKPRIPATLALVLATAVAARPFEYLFAGCVAPAALPEGHDYLSAENLSLAACDKYLAAAPDARAHPYSVWIPSLGGSPSQCFGRSNMRAAVDWGDGAACPSTQARIGFSAAFSGFRPPPRPQGKTTILKREQVYCPSWGTACRLSSLDGYGYECVDTSSAPDNCGGCAFGEFRGTGNWASRLGVDCGGVGAGCRAGRCVNEW